MLINNNIHSSLGTGTPAINFTNSIWFHNSNVAKDTQTICVHYKNWSDQVTNFWRKFVIWLIGRLDSSLEHKYDFHQILTMRSIVKRVPAMLKSLMILHHIIMKTY